MTTPETIRVKLRHFIMAAYPTVEKFAQENALDKTTLSRILNGKREPKITTLLRITEALHLTLSDLCEPVAPIPKTANTTEESLET